MRAILGKRTTHVIGLLDAAARVAADVMLIAARADQFAFGCGFFLAVFFASQSQPRSACRSSAGDAAFRSGRQPPEEWVGAAAMSDPAIPPIFAAITTDLRANRPRADACGFGNGLRRLPAFDLPHDPLSTKRREAGILVLNGKSLRVFLIGFELSRPGGPRQLVAGRQIMRSHYEMIADRSTGLALGQELPLGTHGHKFTVVGLMKNETTSSGDPVGYITLHDAQALQFELAAPAERREIARAGPLQTTDQINAVIASIALRPHQ
jgi:hypothetical protein